MLDDAHDHDCPSQIAQLNVSERIQLAEDIWDSIAPGELPLSDAQRAAIDRRLQVYRDDPQSGASWQEVQQRARRH